MSIKVRSFRQGAIDYCLKNLKIGNGALRRNALRWHEGEASESKKELLETMPTVGILNSYQKFVQICTIS